MSLVLLSNRTLASTHNKQSNNKGSYLQLGYEPFGGSDGARTLMYDRIVSSTSSKRSTIHCFKVLYRTQTSPRGAIANLSLEYLMSSGQKYRNAMIGVKAFDSWQSSTESHTKRCGSFSVNVVMTMRKLLRGGKSNW